MNWNCLIWSAIALFNGIFGALVSSGILEPLDTREITFLLTMFCMICAVVFAAAAAKEDDDDGNKNKD